MDQIVIPGLHQVPIDRRKSPSSEYIYKEHFSGNGLPVILTDAITAWPALSSWSLDFFKKKYGSETVAPGTGVYGKSRRIMKLAHFIDYVERPANRPRGFWLDMETMRPREEKAEDKDAPLYLYDQNLFLMHPELLRDVKPDPECVDDWLALLPDDLQRLLQATKYYQRGLLIGPQDSVARLHYDFLNSHGYLAQIMGRKLCILFSPADSENLYAGEVCPENPDLETRPLFAKATAFVGTLEPGELLLIPSRWWHYVRNLEKTITVNYNFFNRVNFGNYVGSLVKVLPEVVQGFDRIHLQSETGIVS